MTGRAFISAMLIFAVAGLFGPLINWLTWPPSKFAPESSLPFIYQLVFLLWPAQPFGIMETSIGRTRALSLAVGINVLVFSIVGIAAASVARRQLPLAGLYAAVCGLVVMLAMWGAGFSLAHLNMLAIITALLLYAIPFWVVARFLTAAR